MKWFIVVFLPACCAAQELRIQTAKVPSTDAFHSIPRIIGGMDTTIEKYPYIVQVLYFRQAACGGSLITTRHVLSAAHCFFDSEGNAVDPRHFTIRAGSTFLGSGGTIHSVSATITHEYYTPLAHEHDVAVLLLASAVVTGPTVAIAMIPEQGNEVPDNSTVVHLGWGTTTSGQGTFTPSTVLQEVEIKTINRELCVAQYELYEELTNSQGRFPVTANMICSGLFGIGGKDACQGDSGGPLEFHTANGSVVVGITSWGAGCADPRFPGVNTKVSAYTNWINATVTRYNASPPMRHMSGILIVVSIVASLILVK